MSRMRVFAVGALLAVVRSVMPAVASGDGPNPERANYIVQFRAEPGAGGERLDAIEHEVLRTAGVSEARIGYRYRTTLTGFSARLTAEEAGRLLRRPEVASVVVDQVRRAQPRRSVTVDTAEVAATAAPAPVADPSDTSLGGQTAGYLGLPDGLWAQLGGPDHAGEDVIVGVIDSGVYPEHPSFADQPIAADGTRNYIGPAYDAPPDTWRGICQPGENFTAASCNNKLIGARFFVDGWGAAGVAAQDFLSPRDAEGHGTGVASIAAGNYGVDPSFLGNDLGIGVISGIAPRARVAMYKAVWAIPAFNAAGFAADSDLVAAIDAAVADGVDVLNMPIGGAIDRPPFTEGSTMLDPVALALLRAFDAGVVSVLSAGNDGPDPETIESPGQVPWVISAGESALSTTFAATATVSGGPDGPTIIAPGISPTPAVPAVPFIDGAAAAASGVDPSLAERCRPGALDPALVKGKAVLCQPGSAIFPSTVLSDIGAAAGVFYFPNLDIRYTAEDVWLPSIVVSESDGVAIKQLLASAPNATLALTAGTVTPTTTGDIVVDSSARGPTLGSPNVLKPDVLAPGEEIIAAQTPEVPAGGGELFDFSQPGNLFRPLSGTSPATANVAGAAALLVDLDPDLSPSAVKSALMTTAQTAILQDDLVPSVPAAVTDRGAGRIDPNRAADAGLFVSETASRFHDFVESEAPTRDPAQPPVEASDLNLPSIAFDPLVGPRSTRRTFTSTDSETTTWQASFEGLTGIAAVAEPAQFSVAAGESVTLELSFDPAAGRPGRDVDGALVLTNQQDGRTVRLPVALRPEVFEMPEQLNFGATTAAGGAPLVVPTGYEGQLSAVGYGLARPETLRDQTVDQDETDGEDVSQPRPGVAPFDLEVPAGSQALAVELGGASLNDPFAELGVYVFFDFNGDGFTMDDLLDFTEVGRSVLIPDPDPGSYRISVHGFSANPVATFDLTTWLINDPVPDQEFAVTGDPVPVTPGGRAELQIGWQGLDEPGVYLGLISFHQTANPNAGDVLGETIVAITRPE